MPCAPLSRHDVETVFDEGLVGATGVRRYQPGSHAGIAVLRVDSQSARTVADALTTFRGHLVRIRRPD